MIVVRLVSTPNVHHTNICVPIAADFSVRLQGGASNSEGFVEISYQGEWGAVCHNGWTKKDADVVCRQLGYPSAIYYWRYGYVGTSSVAFKLDAVDCTGREPNLAACSHRRWGDLSSNCMNNARTAGVTCNDTSSHQSLIPSDMPLQGICSVICTRKRGPSHFITTLERRVFFRTSFYLKLEGAEVHRILATLYFTDIYDILIRAVLAIMGAVVSSNK